MRYISTLFLFLVLLFSVQITGFAQKQQFPIFDNQRIPRPTDLPLFTASDFVLNPAHVQLYQETPLYGNEQSLTKLLYDLQHTPTGRATWLRQCAATAQVLNQWDFTRTGMGVSRYVFNAHQLENLALVYALSGQPQLGQFLKAHLLQIANLPIEFWLNSELRGYYKPKPLGMLETSALCNNVAFTLFCLKPDAISEHDNSLIRNALYNKGLIPVKNWIDSIGVTNKNNFTPVICNGAYVAAKYLGDADGMKKANTLLTKYLNESFEVDGSYGEGMTYFNFPVRGFFQAIMTMSDTDRKLTVENSGLRKSARWKVYPLLFKTDALGKIQPNVLHFGDNSFWDNIFSLGPTPTINLLLALLYNDGLATWMYDKMEFEPELMDLLLIHSFSSGLPQSVSPQSAKLPLVKAFDSGDAYIRSNWENNGIAMGLFSGNGSRVRYSHQRPEYNSICMGAYGEYLLVSPGSASYRSPIYYQYDATTRGANTITINDKNQLFPKDWKFEKGWNNTDVSSFFVEGNPEAKIEVCQSGKLADVLVSEASKAYHVDMKNARRSVLYLKEMGCFVLVDRYQAVDSKHTYTWRMHFNNKDSAAVFNKISNSQWHLSRPMASLGVYLFADVPVTSQIGKGYLHGPERDYVPGGVFEGFEGSSIELKAYNATVTNAVTYYSVLFPAKKGNTTPTVTFNNGRLLIGKTKLVFKSGLCTIEKLGDKQCINLW